MADKTAIEWTDATWNPVTGCSKVSAGCKHCYAEREWPRMTRLVPSYAGCDFTEVRTHGDRLDQPIRWAKRRMIFVNSMSDLFHQDVSDDFIDSVFGVMWACLYGRNEQDGHIFQVLTKRAERMHDYFKTDRREAWARAAVNHGGGIDPDGLWDQTVSFDGPHPRIWLGVSVEDQAAADERIPLLLDTPAAVRWISVEPLLGPVRLSGLFGLITDDEDVRIDALNGSFVTSRYQEYPTPLGARLDWVVVGGESGPNARPMHPDWARSLRDQCSAAGVPFLFKQWGEWGNDGRVPMLVSIHEKSHFLMLDGKKFEGPSQCSPKGTAAMLRIGKKAAGRLLDGVQHDGYPTTNVVSFQSLGNKP